VKLALSCLTFIEINSIRSFIIIHSYCSSEWITISSSEICFSKEMLATMKTWCYVLRENQVRSKNTTYDDSDIELKLNTYIYSTRSCIHLFVFLCFIVLLDVSKCKYKS
jgi:hypothetical protein